MSPENAQQEAVDPRTSSIRDALLRLAPRARHAFLLRWADGLNDKETAKVLGVAPWMAQTYLSWAEMTARQVR